MTRLAAPYVPAAAALLIAAAAICAWAAVTSDDAPIETIVLSKEGGSLREGDVSLTGAELVVLGTVVQVSDGKRRVQPDGLLSTDVYSTATVAVDRVVAGRSRSATVGVVVWGGIVDGVEWHYFDAGPKLAAGQEVLLVLTTERAPADHWIVVDAYRVLRLGGEGRIVPGTLDLDRTILYVQEHFGR